MAGRPVGCLIMGGGVGGLAAAHRLVMAGYRGRIVVVERNASCGGIARSGWWDMPVGAAGGHGHVRVPTEVSWRVFGDDYVCWDSIVRDIPVPSDADPARTLDAKANFTPITDPFLMVSETADIRRETSAAGTPAKGIRASTQWESLREYASTFWPQMSARQRLRLLNKMAYGISSCRARVSGELGALSWRDYVGGDLPATAEPWLVRVVAPVLGVDMYRAAASAFFEYAEHWAHADRVLGHTFVGSKPTSEAWFSPWERFLEARGVEIRRDTSVTSLETHNVTVVSATTLHGPSGARRRVAADWFVCALPMEAAAGVLGPAYPQARQLAQLTRLCLQAMCCVQIYWAETVRLERPRTGVIMIDSPWALIVEPQSAFWRPTGAPDADQRTSTFIPDHYGGVGDIWSVGLCDERRKGILYGKRWQECSREELFAEVYAQLTASSVLRAACSGAGGKPLTEIRVLGCHLWDSWRPRGSDGLLTTNEPKSSPNAGSWAVRPAVQSAYRNMAFGAVYARSGAVSCFRMETAASNGFSAAELVLRAENGGGLPPIRGHGRGVRNHARPHPRLWPWLCGPVRLLDQAAWDFGLPHPSALCGGQPLLCFVLVWIGLLWCFVAWLRV